jgi:DNA polymerase-3 subunit delta'
MIIGHEKIWNFLRQSAARNRLAHAYLFVGPPELGKKKLAIEFVKGIECRAKADIAACGACPDCSQIEKGIHPDVLFAGSSRGGEEKERASEIKIEEARHIQHHLSLSPFSGKMKAVIIDSAENLNTEAANCLLKTIEEPSAKSILILISSAWQMIPPTILSRCQLIRFSSIRKELIEEGLQALKIAGAAEIKKAAVCCCGRPGAAIKIIEGAQTRLLRENAIVELKKILKGGLAERFSYAAKLAQNPLSSEILEHWMVWHRDRILEALGLAGLMAFGPEPENGRSLKRLSFSIRKITEAQQLMKESGFNMRLILENLMLALA